MQITVKLHGILREYLPPDSSGATFNMTLDEGETLNTVLEQLGIPNEVLLLAFLDRQQISLDDPLADSSNLWLFPPIAGG